MLTICGFFCTISFPLLASTCLTCRCSRGRKIRCDSTRPTCNNCVRRSNICEYDAVPKRRGPDKRPGTRQRSCKKRPPAPDGFTPPPPTKRKKTGEYVERQPSSSASSPPKSPLKEDSKRSPSSTDLSDTTALHARPVHPGPPTDLRITTDQAFLLKVHSYPSIGVHADC